MSRSVQEEQGDTSEPRVEETVVVPTKDTTLMSQAVEYLKTT
jgi:hypothetical protein